MKYTMVRLFLVALSCCTLIASANTASAGWRHRHGGGASAGSYGSYGSSGGGYVASYGSSGGGYGSYGDVYGSSGGGWGGSSGGSWGAAYGSMGGAYGSSGGGQRVGLFSRLFHHHRGASYGSSGGYAASGCYTAGYGSSGGSSGGYYSAGYGSSGGAVSYGSSGGGYGSSGGGYGSSGGGVVVPYESGYLGVSNQSPASAASLASYQADSPDAIYLNVAVPPAAKVFVNDTATTSVGASRQFVSRGLQSGKKYKFVVRAEVVGADGRLASEEKTVTLTAGQRDELSFASLDQTPVQTAVTLNVPAEAQVILAGNATSATGQTRTFRTSQLKAGERWDDYVVEVHYAGKVKRETLRLVAGDDVALSFDFDNDKSLVASR